MHVTHLPMRRYAFVAALFCLAGSPASPLQASPILFGITQDDILLAIDPTTGIATQRGVIGPSATISPIGLAARGSDLYTFNANASGNATELMRLNPTTAAVLSTLGVGLTGAFPEGDLAFRSDGIGFVSSTGFPATGGFYSFDITGPSSATLKAPLAGNTSFDGLAFNASDALFGLQQGGANLYTLNPSNGNPTLVGPTLITGVFGLGGLAFASDGTLFGVLSNNNLSNLYRISPLTGTGLFVGSITVGGAPAGKVSGITFLDVDQTPSEAVPEPATLLMLGGGLSAIRVLRRKRKRWHPGVKRER